MSGPAVLLKQLLSQRHWQHYPTFCSEYDKAARSIDKRLVGTWPSRAQLHRWLSGSLKRLPYPEHCRVLEQTLPGYTAQELFAAPNDASAAGRSSTRQGSATAPGPSASSVAASDLTVISAISARQHLERAFTREHVSVDFAGFSGETLHGAIQEPLDKIRTGVRRPASIRLRLLLLDVSKPLPIPCRSDDHTDDPKFRERAKQIFTRHTQAIRDTLDELASLDLVSKVEAQVRLHDCPPPFKLYILNEQEVLFGFYPIKQHEINTDGERSSIYDLMGKDAMLFRFASDGPPTNEAYVQQARAWFESVWTTISREYPL